MYHLDQDAIEVFEGHIELEESYFGDARQGKRGRGAAAKVIVSVYSKVMVKSTQ